VPIDPVGLNLAKLFPLATVTSPTALATNGGYNYVTNPTRNTNMTQILARVDYSISDNTKLFVRYNRQRESMDQPISVYGEQSEWFLPWPTPVDGKNFSDSVSSSLTHVFSPTLTMEAVGTYTRFGIRNKAQDYSKMTRTGVGFPYSMYWDQPVMPNIQGNIATWWGGREGPTIMNPGGGEVISTDKKFYTAAFALTKVAGTHTLKVGGNADYASDSSADPWVSNGEIELGKVPGGANGAEATWANWSATDNILADLLSGQVSGFGQDHSVNPVAYKGKNVEGFVQDSWKVRPNFTVDAGLRVSYLGKWEDADGIGSAVWYPELYASDVATYGNNYYLPGARWHARDSSVPVSGVQRATVFYSPRIGFAWDTTGKGNTVLRGGFGVFRYMEDAFLVTKMMECAQGQWNVNNGGNGRPFSVIQQQADQYVANAAGVLPKPDAGWNGNGFWYKGDKEMPVTYNWSFTLQQRLPLSMVLEASYVGNKQDHLLLGVGGTSNAAQMGDINFAPNYAGSKPYANYNFLNITSHALYQNYHAGQFSLARQRGPLTFMLSYTFSKNLGFRGYGYGSGSYVGQVTDPDYTKRVAQLRKTDYGVLGQDRTHTINFSYNYSLPELRSKPTLLRVVLGGWQVSGVSTYYTGQPLQGQGTVNAAFGMNGTNSQGVNLRPGDMIDGFPQGTENALNFTLFPQLICDPRKDVPAGYYFNPACFVAPQRNDPGIGMMPIVRGPSYSNHDLSVFKNFGLGAARKLQLRVSAFNVLNHAQTYPTTNSFRLSFDHGVQTNTDFGKIPTDEPVIVNGKTYQAGANKFGRRIVQLSAKFFF